MSQIWLWLLKVHRGQLHDITTRTVFVRYTARYCLRVERRVASSWAKAIPRVVFVVVVDMSKKLERNESSDKLCNLPGVKEFDNSAFQEPSHKAPNVNVSWMAKRGAWSFQVIMILGMRYLLGVFGSSAFCWSLIFYLYAGATFYVFHC